MGKLDNVYRDHLKQIRKEKEVLDDKLGEMNGQVRNIEKHIDSITQAKDERYRELDKFVENIHKSLDEQMKDKVLDLLSKKEKLQEDISKLEGCHRQVIGQIEYSSKPKLIKKTEDLVIQIRGISNQVASQKFSLDKESVKFKSELFPDYIEGEFIIEHYLQMIEEKEIIYSKTISNCGITWRLKVYPNGNGQAKGNYLSVFLEMKKGYPSVAKYDYKIEMENTLSSANNVSREYTSEFEVGECWGYNRFYRTESIMNEGFVSQTGSLRLKFFVRASSYAQHCKDQSRYIENLEVKLKRTKEEGKESESEEEKEEESDQEEQQDDELDQLPMSESKMNHYSSEDDKNEEPESLKQDNSDPSECENHDSLNHSLQAESDTEQMPAVGIVVEERKNNLEDMSNISGEIENHIDEFKQVINRDRAQADIYPMNDHIPEMSESEHDIGAQQAEDHYEGFLKDISETENQLNQLRVYNQSFNREMSSKYGGGYNTDSDEESVGAGYDTNDLRSDTSDGNLSREEEKKEHQGNGIQSQLIEVSPDSPENSVRGLNKTDQELLQEVLFKDVINQFRAEKRNISMQDDKDSDSDLTNEEKIKKLLKRSSERLNSGEN